MRRAKMSRQSEAKEAQGYDPKPVAYICKNCHYFGCDVLDYRGFNGEVRFQQLKNLRCNLGGFAVKKTARCEKFAIKEGGAGNE